MVDVPRGLVVPRGVIEHHDRGAMSHDTENNDLVDGKGGESNEPAVRTEWSESRLPSVAVVEAVGEATDRDMTDLPQLNDSIDPDALDVLVTQRPSAPLAISFRYAGTRVSVRRDGWIEIRAV